MGDSRGLLQRAKSLFIGTLLPVTRYTAIIFLLGGFIVWTVHCFEVKYLKNLVWAYTAQPVVPMEEWPLLWSWMAGHLPVPASPYFQGLGEFFTHATSGHRAYLAGEFSSEGWWYYFPVAFLLKTPLPSLLLIFAASFSVIRARGDEWRKEAFLWLPVLFYLLVSMGVSVNIGYRHILPVVPLLYLFAGRLLRSADEEESEGSASFLSLRQRALVAAVPLLWLALAAGSAWPHFLSYFNPLAGGPQGGHRWLLDSNIDWGQDLVSLKSWMEEKELASVKLSYFGSVFPGAYYGIEYECLPTFGAQNREQCPGLREVEMEPGWYVVSVNHLHGLAIRGDPFAEFRQMKPAERIGNSMLVFQIDSAPPR